MTRFQQLQCRKELLDKLAEVQRIRTSYLERVQEADYFIEELTMLLADPDLEAANATGFVAEFLCQN